MRHEKFKNAKTENKEEQNEEFSNYVTVSFV